MVNLPINLDFLKFSSFFASLKGRVSPAMAGQKCHHLQSPEFEVRLGRPFIDRAARVGRIPLACALLARTDEVIE